MLTLEPQDLSEPLDPYIEAAGQLEATYRHNYISRAQFIREQCNDLDGRETFDKYRDDWGIWNFITDIQMKAQITKVEFVYGIQPGIVHIRIFVPEEEKIIWHKLYGNLYETKEPS